IREKTDSVVIFSGEGADELTQGYIYFHKVQRRRTQTQPDTNTHIHMLWCNGVCKFFGIMGVCVWVCVCASVCVCVCMCTERERERQRERESIKQSTAGS